MTPHALEAWGNAITALNLVRHRLDAGITHFPHLVGAITACEILPLLARDPENSKGIKLLSIFENYQNAGMAPETSTLIQDFLAEMHVGYRSRIADCD